jgi:hypothetical protein
MRALLMISLALIACSSPTTAQPGLAHRGAWLTGVRYADAPLVVDEACHLLARSAACVLKGLMITFRARLQGPQMRMIGAQKGGQQRDSPQGLARGRPL